MRILNLSFGAYKLYCGISVIDTSLHTLIRFQKGQIRNREYAEDNLIEFYRDLTLVSQKLSLSRYSALINKSAIIELLSSICFFVSYIIHHNFWNLRIIKNKISVIVSVNVFYVIKVFSLTEKTVIRIRNSRNSRRVCPKSFQAITLGCSRQMIFNLQGARDALFLPAPYLSEVHVEGVPGVGATLA